MSVLDFAALGILGITLTGATIGFSSPKLFLAAGGDVGIPIADALGEAPAAQRLAGVRFGGEPSRDSVEPAVAAFPRAF
ncbi:hypothetical protein [Xanthobacter pseudotagetidis]|uniref:hypothetical protein n=1 Tax=Xanthobacter pseudotagetidis TaxID=3119911 RepID=UPI0037281C3A